MRSTVDWNVVMRCMTVYSLTMGVIVQTWSNRLQFHTHIHSMAQPWTLNSLIRHRLQHPRYIVRELIGSITITSHNINILLPIFKFSCDNVLPHVTHDRCVSPGKPQGETITIYSLNSWTSDTVDVCAGHWSVNDRGISNKEPTPNIKKLENKMLSTERMAQRYLRSAVVEEGKQRELKRKWKEIWKAEKGNKQ
jgi:hypothetical protein